MLFIGVDPHPATHTAAMLGEHGQEQRNEARKWAIEGANNPLSRPLGAHLLQAGEHLHAIHPSLTSLYRSRRTKAKTDEIDAQHVPRVLLAQPQLPVYTPCVTQQRLQALTLTRARVSAQLKANQMALKPLLDQPELRGVRQVVETLIDRMKEQIAQLDAQLRVQVKAQQPELLSVYGVDVVLAGTILAEVGDIRRFATRDQFAAYCGAAPVPRGSGGSSRWCVNTGGNRRLNYVLHMIVLTRKGLTSEPKGTLRSI